MASLVIFLLFLVFMLAVFAFVQVAVSRQQRPPGALRVGYPKGLLHFGYIGGVIFLGMIAFILAVARLNPSSSIAVGNLLIIICIGGMMVLICPLLVLEAGLHRVYFGAESCTVHRVLHRPVTIPYTTITHVLQKRAGITYSLTAYGGPRGRQLFKLDYLMQDFDTAMLLLENRGIPTSYSGNL